MGSFSSQVFTPTIKYSQVFSDYHLQITLQPTLQRFHTELISLIAYEGVKWDNFKNLRGFRNGALSLVQESCFSLIAYCLIILSLMENSMGNSKVTLFETVVTIIFGLRWESVITCMNKSWLCDSMSSKLSVYTQDEVCIRYLNI